jgi:hypothetical protein
LAFPIGSASAAGGGEESAGESAAAPILFKSDGAEAMHVDAMNRLRIASCPDCGIVFALWLIPVDTLGRQITNDKDFEACGYSLSRFSNGTVRYGLCIWLSGGFKMMQEELAKQKGGTSARPIILPPGSKEDKPALSLTAA